MYPSFPTQCTFVGLLDDAPTGSRTQSIINQKAENHKEGLDTFQSMFQAVTNKKNVSLLQAAVSVHIRSFSGTKSSRVNEAIAVEIDVLYSELKNNISWHNASTIRRVFGIVAKSWDIDALSEKVSEMVNVHGLQSTYNDKCMVTPYKRESGNLVCVLGTHHNKDVHDIEMTVTAGGLDWSYI